MGIKEAFQNSSERIVTGLVLLCVVVLVAIIDSFFVTWAVLGLAYMIAFYEACQLFGAKENKLYVLALGLWVFAAFYPNPDDLIFLVLILLTAMMVHQKSLDVSLLYPFIYPSASMLFLFALYHDYGIGMFGWLVVIVALTDTCAYFVGKSIGKTPFSPTSPNKTWEGVMGGIGIATIVGTFVGLTFVSFWTALAISLAVSSSSVWGDLFESYLKRRAEVKDSGNIFPGHGGMLDRLDGYLFGGIVLVVLLRGLA